MRRLVVLLLAFSMAFAVACTIPTPGAWTQYRNDAAGTGVATSPGGISTSTVGGLTLEFTAVHSHAPTGPNWRRPPTGVVANGVLYIVDVGRLYAYDADGITNCDTGAPRSCRALWFAPLHGNSEALSPAIVGNRVITITESSTPGVGAKIEAFDAGGVENCGPNPYGPVYPDVVCTSVWTSGFVNIATPPVVANGFVYAGDASSKLAAWDASGSTNCSGTPKVCVPVWTTTNDAPGGGEQTPLVAVSGSTVVASPMGPGRAIYAYDAFGQTNCSGSPKVCTPLWQTAAAGNVHWPSGPGTVAADRAFVPKHPFDLDAEDGLAVYPTGGTTVCPTAPNPCAPVWTGRTTDPLHPAGTPLPVMFFGATALNANRVFVPLANSVSGPAYTAAYAADAGDGCSGVPLRCEPLYYFDRASITPVVANGVLFAGGAAYDAAGVENCSGVPRMCTPLWVGSDPTLGTDASIVVDGRVYETREGGLSVYRLPG